MKISEAKLLAASQVLSVGRGLAVPPYQRPYKWDAQQTKALMEDILKAFHQGENFFLGTLLLRIPEGNARKEIIDGQQRLVTLFLLIAAIHERTNSLANDLYIRLEPDAILRIELNSTITEDSSTDRSFIGRLLRRHTGSKQAVVVRAAFEEIRKQINPITDVELGDLSLFISEKINFVEVTVASIEDAYSAFEVMNSRSTPLTAYELIRSFCITKSPNSAIASWRKIDEYTNQLTSDIQERFVNDLLCDAYLVTFGKTLSMSTGTARSVFSNARPLLMESNGVDRLCRALTALGEAAFELLKGYQGFKEAMFSMRQWGARPLILVLLASHSLTQDIQSLMITLSVRCRIAGISDYEVIKLWQQAAREIFIDKSIDLSQYLCNIFSPLDQHGLFDNRRFFSHFEHYCPQIGEAAYLLMCIERHLGGEIPNTSLPVFQKTPQSELTHEPKQYYLFGNWFLGRITSSPEQFLTSHATPHSIVARQKWLGKHAQSLWSFSQPKQLPQQRPQPTLRALSERSNQPTRASVRKLLDEKLIGNSDVDAFCIDHFPDVYRRFGGDMDRVAKCNILLQYAPLDNIVRLLTEE